jgi:hypothetical protein
LLPQAEPHAGAGSFVPQAEPKNSFAVIKLPPKNFRQMSNYIAIVTSIITFVNSFFKFFLNNKLM